MEIIDRFTGDYYFLSNFYNAPVLYSGLLFQNAEAAFQSAKCPGRMEEFCHLNPSAAKRIGRKVKLRTEWNEVSGQVMYEVCKAKFTQNDDLRRKLKDTGNAILIEGNSWGDHIWGVCNGFGENRLGKTLMRIRDELRSM